MIYEDEFIYIEKEEFEIPWIKIFSKTPYKELSDCDEQTLRAIFKAMMLSQKLMLKYFNPTKINIASFGNYLPHFHLHIQARFENDSFFPEPTWGKKQRDGSIEIKNFDEFAQALSSELTNIIN